MHGRVLLTADVPAATLDRRQSAIGSLAFEVVGGGDVSAFWELMDGSSGLVDAHSGVITSPMYGRRPIVELTGHRLLIGLRHVRELRRLVVLVSGSEPDLPQRLVMDLHDESTLETTHTTANGPVIAALALYNVDGELVIRREGFGFATTDAVSTAYGIPVTWLPPVQRH